MLRRCRIDTTTRLRLAVAARSWTIAGFIGSRSCAHTVIHQRCTVYDAANAVRTASTRNTSISHVMVPLTAPKNSIATTRTTTRRAMSSTSSASGGKEIASAPTSSVVAKKSLWARAKAEAVHFWMGTKLLVKESRISTRLLWKLLRGTKLTRREHTQLVRTAKDLFRLIPFSIFIIVPFMELLLPVALKLFPNMLPSTYSDKEKEDAKRRQAMATKLNMAKFLRDSISETAVSVGPKAVAAQEFAAFFKKYRTSGERASTTEVLGMCQKFSDDLTLDNLSRPQLVTLCRFMGVNAFGTDNFVRFVLRKRMQEIKADDKMIDAEGIDSLTVAELIAACQSRGIRTIDVHPDRLRYELQQWLDLNIKNEIPSSLLILSRALMMTDRPAQPADTAEALQTTLTSLPDEVVEEAELRLSEAEGKISFEKKLEIIQKEEERIADELAEAKATKNDTDGAPADKIAADATDTNDETLTKEQLRELGETLNVITANTEKERQQLQELKEDRQKLAQETAMTIDAADAKLAKTKKKQLRELDELIGEVDAYLNAMESDKERQNIASIITADLQGNITTAQLETALKMIRHAPDEDRIKAIVRRLDTDGDGRIFLKEILELAEELGESEGQGVVVKPATGASSAPTKKPVTST